MIDTDVIRVLVDSTVGVKRDQIVALCNEIDRLRGEQQPPPYGKGIVAPYGYCPVCGSPGRTRERRPNGNDTCANGHSYPSKTSKIWGSIDTMPPQGKTVEFTTIVYVDSYGNIARDRDEVRMNLGGNFRRYTITATLPVPAEVTVVAKVEGK